MKEFNKKFEIGDTVVFYGHSVSSDSERKRYEEGLVPVQNDERHLKVGGEYVVVATADEPHGFYMDIQGVSVKGDNIVVHGCSSSSFIKVNTKKLIMKTLGVMMKKLLDSDTQTLVKAGYIDGDLTLTEKGEAAMFAVLFDANKAALVADAQVELDAEGK